MDGTLYGITSGKCSKESPSHPPSTSPKSPLALGAMNRSLCGCCPTKEREGLATWCANTAGPWLDLAAFMTYFTSFSYARASVYPPT